MQSNTRALVFVLLLLSLIISTPTQPTAHGICISEIGFVTSIQFQLKGATIEDRFHGTRVTLLVEFTEANIEQADTGGADVALVFVRAGTSNRLVAFFRRDCYRARYFFTDPLWRSAIEHVDGERS